MPYVYPVSIILIVFMIFQALSAPPLKNRILALSELAAAYIFHIYFRISCIYIAEISELAAAYILLEMIRILAAVSFLFHLVGSQSIYDGEDMKVASKVLESITFKI